MLFCSVPLLPAEVPKVNFSKPGEGSKLLAFGALTVKAASKSRYLRCVAVLSVPVVLAAMVKKNDE